MFVYLQKLLNCLIIYSYKTNSSFSPCPWNLRSNGPSNFKYIKLFISETSTFFKLFSANARLLSVFSVAFFLDTSTNNLFLISNQENISLQKKYQNSVSWEFLRISSVSHQLEMVSKTRHIMFMFRHTTCYDIVRCFFTEDSHINHAPVRWHTLNRFFPLPSVESVDCNLEQRQEFARFFFRFFVL